MERIRESEKNPEEIAPIKQPQAEAKPEEVLAMSMLWISRQKKEPYIRRTKLNRSLENQTKKEEKGDKKEGEGRQN